jgi:hypothetical protein
MVLTPAIGLSKTRADEPVATPGLQAGVDSADRRVVHQPPLGVVPNARPVHGGVVPV